MLAYEATKGGMQQGPVIKICPQGDEDSQMAVCLCQGSVQQVQKMSLHGLISDQREQLLELVNHQHHLVIRAGQHLLQGTMQAIGMLHQLFIQVIGHAHRHTRQCIAQVRQGERPRRHGGQEPFIRMQHGPPAQGRDHAGPHRAGFAAAAGADHRQKVGLAQVDQQLVDQGFAAIKIGSIRLVKRAQALIGVARVWRRWWVQVVCL